ncbi:MAG: magnesium transporter [Lachnospiraceae bacterium]
MEEKELEVLDETASFPEKPDYEQELISIMESNLSDTELKERLSDYHENDIANILERLTPIERRRLYRVLGIDAVSEIFTYLEDVGKYIEELDSDKAADIIESMDADDAVDVLDELEDNKSHELISLMDEEARHDIDLIQSYADDEIGSRMTTNFIVIQNNVNIKQAMKSLVEQAGDNDNISTIYVVDEDAHFYGAIDLKDLIVARQYTELESLISTSFPYVYAKETISDCIEDLKEYSEDSIPVLDNDKTLLGVITAQDIVEVVDEEFGEDYAKLAGLTEEEDLQEPLSASIKKRLPWLIILLFLGLAVSTVVGMFESVISQLTLIVSFQSLILGMAGNVGTQSLAVTIRVLVDESVNSAQKWKLVLKEIRIGCVNGFLVGLLAFLFVGSYILLGRGKSVFFSFAVSGCIGLAMWAAMIISSMMGTLIPLFLHKIKVDPAVASGPLISTINDLVAVVTYYGLTWILLLNILHLVE